MKYNKIYLKITTVPNQLEVNIDSKEIEIFKNKYESHKSFIKDSDVELAYLNESAVNGSFAKIYSITLGFVMDGYPVVKTIYGEERNLLDKLLEILGQKEFKDAELVMYNRAFVLSFLSKRFRYHNYPTSLLPVSLQIYGRKAWTMKGSKCIQDFVKGISYQTENFAETCYIHNIPVELIEGSDVGRYYKKKEMKTVRDSDLQYVYALMQVDAQLSESGELKEMVGVHEEAGVVKKKEINVLDHILASGNLSTPVVNSIVSFTENNGLDKENVLTLVKTALSKTKEYQKVEEEDYYELKEALGLVVDYSKIQPVVDKGNLGKKEADLILLSYIKSPSEEKKQVIGLVEQFLKEKNKFGQKRAKESFDYLSEKLK